MPEKRKSGEADEYAGVEPAYLWIMPEFLEFTEVFTKAMPSFLEQYNKMSDIKAKRAFLLSNEEEFYLYLLCKGIDTIYGKMARILLDDPGYHQHDRLTYRSLSWDFPKRVTEVDYVRSAVFVKALKAIGIGVHGGVLRMCFLQCRRCLFFPTESLIVEDAESARKFFIIGVHLGSDIKLDARSSTVDEASKNYTRLSELITCYNLPDENWADIKTKMARNTIEGNAEDVIWEYKRMKFRAKIVIESRKILINKAVEVKIYEKRGFKRVRSNDEDNDKNNNN